MGKLNLLKGSYDGKVGQTVGAKWKNKSTIRTYTKPSDPNTEAQKTVRTVFGDMTAFIALFSDQIKYKSALDTSGMSVRNAIVKMNASQIKAGAFDASTLKISKGGLQKPVLSTATLAATTGEVVLTWNPPTATNFSEDAQMIVVAVDEDDGLVDVFEADASGGTATGTLSFTGSTGIHVYAYFLDFRGSAKVASLSSYKEIL